jgi:hypothetical protein
MTIGPVQLVVLGFSEPKFRGREAPAPAGAPDYAAEPQQLATLKQQGILTEEEFEAKKKQILGM